MKIIPYPNKLVKIGEDFVIDNDGKIYCEDKYIEQAKHFANLVEDSCGVSLQFVDEIAQANFIFSNDEKAASEGYFIMISQGILTVSASTQQGCFYAVETLRQVFDMDGDHELLTCPNLYIEDAPQFTWRGMHFDICRHFFGVDVIKQIIDLMARVKLNKLHLHLSDDQGFRVQIDKYPLLNSVASVREGSEVVKDGKRYVDDVVCDGYLTKQDVATLVEYAASKFIDIVPEIDMPGHFVAALAAYPQFSCTGNVTEVRKKWGISKDILCAGNDESYVFVKDILDEICDMFPYEYVHLGGDEAPKDRWCNCKLCKEKMSQLKLANFNELQTYMIEQFRVHLAEKGKKVICWNDGLTKSSSMEIVSQHWTAINRAKGIKYANKGRKTIMSPNFHMYFDYPYSLTPLMKSRKLNALRGVKKSAKGNILGVEGTLWTEYVDNTDKLFFNLLPRMTALSECAWGSKKKGYIIRVKHYNKLYDKLGLCYNDLSLGLKRRSLSTIKKFWKVDCDVELHKSKTYKEKMEK